MTNLEQLSEREQLPENEPIFDCVKANLEKHLISQYGAEQAEKLDPNYTPEGKIISKMEEISKRRIISEDGGLNTEIYKGVAMDRIDNAEMPNRIGDWLALVETDIKMAEKLKDSPDDEFPVYWHPNFTEVAIRGGQIVKKLEGKKVLTPKQIELEKSVGRQSEIIGEIGGNVTIDFNVLPNLREQDLELLKAAVGAREELDSKDPAYLSYFENPTLGKGKIQADELWTSETEVIRRARHNGKIFRTDIPGVFIQIREDLIDKTNKSVCGYYVFSDRLEKAGQVIQGQ